MATSKVSIGAGKLNDVTVSPEAARLIHASVHAFISAVVGQQRQANNSTVVAMQMMGQAECTPGSSFAEVMDELARIGGL